MPQQHGGLIRNFAYQFTPAPESGIYQDFLIQETRRPYFIDIDTVLWSQVFNIHIPSQ